jgi:O-antigen/teichoic acid export membrane protein
MTQAVARKPLDAALPAASMSLRGRALRGTAWTIGGFGAQQMLRLASNLVLTRLLFPEAFGLMALVAVFMQGLQMFSDVGIGPSIIQDKRGDDPRFLHTAFTIQAIRGVCLMLIGCIGALPFAIFYGEAELRWLVLIAASTALIAGFNSTKLFTANRHLWLGRITIIDLAAQALGLVVMVAWALKSPSVWALAVGGVVASAAKMIASHVMIPGPGDRLHWDADAARSLFRFGRWIFLSTILTFAAMQLDRLIMGKLLDVRTLGIYSIALMLAISARQVVKQVGQRVLFPAIARMAESGSKRLSKGVFKARLSIVLPSTLGLLVLIVFGQPIVALLFDDRYVEAGWMLQILAAGVVASVVCSTYGAVLLARGDSYVVMLLLATQVALLATASVVGFAMYGVWGFVVGVALVEWLNYPVAAWVLWRRGLWQASIDLPVLGVAAVVTVLATGGVVV